VTLSADGLLGAVEAVGERLMNVDPRLGLLALAFHVANHVLRSVAWRNVIAAAYPATRISLTTIAAAYATGVALNAVAPARGGDAVKVALARAAIPGSSVPTLAATMSVLVVFDLLLATVLVVVLGVFGLVPLDPAAAAGGVPLPLPLVLALAATVGVAAWLLARHARRRIVRLWSRVRQGGAVLRTPRRYLRGVVVFQAAAWGCRIAVVFCLLAAFGLPASLPLAGLVMVLAGASTIVPLTPGGAGTQQVLVALALQQTASATAVVSFSVGMQAGITAVNALLGVAAAMAVCRTVRPVAAVRGALAAARGG
jgi:uncharacterized membrane protein YbhN (UPF0104 family)